MAHTFISFSSKDIETAHRVYDSLTARGIDCWISSRDIPTGANYQDEIVKAIESSCVMVLIFSKNANSSEEIKKEMGLASENQLVLMPLRMDDTLATGGFKYNFATSQWIGLYQDFDENIETVVKTINTLTAKQDKFVSIVQESVDEGDDILLPLIKSYLISEGEEIGLTSGQAEKIIHLVKGKTNSNETEIEYLELIEQVLEDKVVSFTERKMLAKKAKQLGISTKRADELLAQEKKKLGIYDSSINEETTVVLQSVVSNLPPISDEDSLNQDDEALEGLILQDEDRGQFQSIIDNLRNKINALIHNSTSVRPFEKALGSAKAYLRFQPNYLYENTQALKDFGLLAIDDDLIDSTIYIFEFHITGNQITFDFKIGKGSQNIRMKLHNIYKKYSDIFTKVMKPNRRLSDSWHLAFQKNILSEEEILQHFENGLDLEELIEVRIRDLFEIDIPKMMNCIDKEINSNDDYDNLYTYQEDNDLSGPSVWHLNTGGRSWKDQMTFHYWIAGGGKKWSDIIRKLKIGDEVFAYLSGKGYVGHGFVKGEPIILNDYVVMHGEFKNQKLSNLSIESSTLNALNENRQITNVDDYEYVISVEWVAALDANDAKSEKGLHISPLTGCKMNNKTLEFLRAVF